MTKNAHASNQRRNSLALNRRLEQILSNIEMWIVRTFFRHLQSSANYIHEVVSHGGVILVNCYMGLSRCRGDPTMTIDYIPHCRSASCVLAYLIAHQNMSLDKVSSLIEQKIN